MRSYLDWVCVHEARLQRARAERRQGARAGSAAGFISRKGLSGKKRTAQAACRTGLITHQIPSLLRRRMPGDLTVELERRQVPLHRVQGLETRKMRLLCQHQQRPLAGP